MFNRTRRSVLIEIEKENPELATLLKSSNELLRMARGKLTYIQKVLEYYNRGAHIRHDKAKEYLRQNVKVLATIEELLEKENSIVAREETRKLVFKQEIKTLNEARETLKKLRHILEKENAILKASYDWKKTPKVVGMRFQYRRYTAMAKVILKEVELLGVESQKIQAVKSGIKMLQERITNSKKMPIVTAKYYYGAYFIFNVGDKVRPSLQRIEKGKIIDVEKIFEEVRKKEFPHRPSRTGAIYVDTHPWTAEDYGVVYAVKVEGISFRTNQDLFSQARSEWKRHKNKQRIEELARAYWKGSSFPYFPEVVVNGTVTILGLADYLREGDRVEVIVDGMKDNRGLLIPKGSKGVILEYDKNDKEVPFFVELENGKEVSLPPSTIRKIKK